MRILITGSNGLLGQKLVRYCAERKIEFLATSLGINRNPNCKDTNYLTLDITNQADVNAVFSKFEPTHIINTAALTNVDKCELEVELCNKINVSGVENLLNYAQKNNCHLQQISTDFIFDGETGNYTEEHTPLPINEYGKSKLKAEQVIINSGYSNFSIVRTSVVYGTGNNLSKSNIVLWAMDELKKGNTVKIVTDQLRAPTFAMDLALGCMKILELNEKGIFNLTGPTALSMYDYVLQIAEFLKLPQHLVTPIDTNALNQKALRPKNSGLNLTKSRELLNYQPSEFNSTLFLMEVGN